MAGICSVSPLHRVMWVFSAHIRLRVTLALIEHAQILISYVFSVASLAWFVSVCYI